jgi:hypothetical protein
VVLDEPKDVMSSGPGQAALCTQASIRHSDLAITALSGVERCRVVGGKTIQGLRAKAGKTKSGPRPWTSSWLAVNPSNDRVCLSRDQCTEKIGKTIASWAVRGTEKALLPPLRRGCYPCQALLADLAAGKSVPMSESEIKSFAVAFM